jgi:hypothetical protein
MRSRTQCRIAIASSVLAALLPMALSVPAFAQPAPGFPSGNPANGYYPASPGRNAVGSTYSDSGAETPWQRRSPPYENRRGGPSYGAGPNWLPGAAGVLGVLPRMGGGTSWPSWEQVPARSEGTPSTSGYQPYPGWATPPSQPNRPLSDAGPSGANWQPQPAPEPSGEAVVMPPRGSTGSSARPPSRTSHPPSGKAAGGGHPVVYPPRKPPLPPTQPIADPPGHPQPAAPVVEVAAVISDAPPAAPPPSAAAAPPPEPPAPANTAPPNPPNPAAPPNPPASAPTQDAAAQPPVKPLQPMSQIGLPLSALVALAVLVFPLRLLTRAWRRRSRRRTARVLLLGDPAASRMISEQSGTQYPAIGLRLRTKPPVATPRWTAA